MEEDKQLIDESNSLFKTDKQLNWEDKDAPKEINYNVKSDQTYAFCTYDNLINMLYHDRVGFTNDLQKQVVKNFASYDFIPEPKIVRLKSDMEEITGKPYDNTLAIPDVKLYDNKNHELILTTSITCKTIAWLDNQLVLTGDYITSNAVEMGLEFAYYDIMRPKSMKVTYENEYSFPDKAQNGEILLGIYLYHDVLKFLRKNELRLIELGFNPDEAGLNFIVDIIVSQDDSVEDTINRLNVKYGEWMIDHYLNCEGENEKEKFRHIKDTLKKIPKVL